jgi:hypothetical protein
MSTTDPGSTYDDAPPPRGDQAFAPGAAREQPPHADDVPTLEPDETIPPRPEEEIADADREDRP